MSRTSKTLKRLGVGSVTVGTVFAMPYVGVTSAFAATPTDPSVQITSQQTNSSSPRNDGTDTTVKISANVTYTPSATASDNTNAPQGVKFSYTPAGSVTPVTIGTDNTFPYSINWAPPAGGGAVTLTATIVDSAGNALGATPSDTQATTVVDAPTVHIVTPAEGGTIGAFGGFVAVSGTRSADAPPLSITAATRNNATGVISAAGAATAVAGTGQTWNASVAVPACAAVSPATCDVVIYAATTGGVAQTDEVTEALEYAQTLTTVTVAPPSATAPAGSSQTYTVTVLDQNGKPVAGLKVNGTSSNTAVAANPGTATTDGTGVATFNVATTTTPGSATLTFQTWTNGASYDQTKDFSRTATITTYASTPTTATLSATPSKSEYAEQTEYTINGASTDFPVVKFCVTDQNGNSTPAGVGQTPVLTGTRRDSTLAATAASITYTPTKTPIAGTGCYYIGIPAATGTYGTDTISGYFEQNGTPGQQTGDPGATALVLNYGNLGITALDTQAQKGTNVTVSFKVTDPSGRPFANRAITLTAPAGAFTSTQPSGTSATPPTGSGAVASSGTLFGTTDANGIVSATVTSATVQTVSVTATDNLNIPNQQKATGVSTSANVDFRNLSVALTTLTKTSAGTLVQPAGNTSAGNPRPGDVIDGIQYRLTDANGQVLRNTAVAVTLDHGYFVGTAQPACAAATPNPERYTNCPFVTAPADGAVTGPIKDAATTTLTSDASGLINFSLAIGRDTGFDDDGTVISKLTAVANGGTVSDNAATWTTNAKPINGGSVKLVPVDPTTALSGDVPVQQGNALGSTANSSYNPVVFAVHVLDQYGNLVSLPTADVKLAVTGGTLTNSGGAGGTTTGTAAGSYTGNETKYYLESRTTSLTGAPATVTATWDTAPVTQFKATTVGTTTTYTTVAGTAATKTDSFTVNFYAIDLQHLVYTFTSTPANSVPVNTAVTTSVTVKDQKGNPVQGLNVQFIRSGPNDAAGNNQGGGSTTRTTGTNGTAGTSYSSGTPGTATVTVIVTDGSGNELSRGVQNVTFTAGTPNSSKPTISIDRTAMNVGQSAIITIKGVAGDSVQFFQRVQPASTFTVFKTFTFNANGIVTINTFPRTNTSYFARTAAGDSSVISLSVRPAVSLRGSSAAHKASFNGVIVPGHGGVKVRIYVVSNGRVGALVATATTDSQGHYTASHQFAGPGRVTFIAQTISDSIALAGQSNRLTLTI